MEEIYSRTSTIIVCSIIASLIDMLVSGTNMQRIVRHILGIFILCAIIFPISLTFSEFNNIDFDLRMKLEQNENFYNMQKNLLEDRIKDLINKILYENKIVPIDTQVLINISDSGIIESIEADIIISFDNVEKKVFVEHMIKDKLGISSNVILQKYN